MARRRFSVYQRGKGKRFKTFQRGGSAMSNISRFIVRNALKQRRSNQVGSNAFKNMGRRVFKALTGKTARSIVKNKVLAWVTNELDKRL